MNFKVFFLLVVFLIFVGAIYFASNFGFDDDFERFLYEVSDFAEEGGVYTVFLFILSYILFTAFFFWIPVWLMSVIGGVLFGLLLGILYSIVGLMLGAVASFQLVRHAELGFLTNFISNKTNKFQKFFNTTNQNSFVTVLILRLIHFVPFRGLNYGAGLTKLSFEDFFLGTFLGIVPGVIFYVYLGDSLMNFEYVDVTFVTILAIIFSLFIYWQKYNARDWHTRIKKEIFKSKVKN